MLLSKDAIADVVEVLHGNDFYRPAHQVIFDCILDLYGRGEPADAITVAAELNRTDQLSKMGGAVYLHTLIASTPTAANAGYYAAIVAEQAVLRRLVEAGTRGGQLGYGAAGGRGGGGGNLDPGPPGGFHGPPERGGGGYSPPPGNPPPPQGGAGAPAPPG